MTRCLLLLTTLALGACTVIKVPDSPPVTADVPPEVQAALTPPTHPATGSPTPPVVDVQPVVYTPPSPPVAPQSPSRRAWDNATPRPEGRPEPTTLPVGLIKEAQRAAQVEPSKRGYHGQSATQRWEWQPGKLYVVYVTASQMTKIVLPPGEMLVSKVFLDPEHWDVQSYRVGSEALPQDVVFVRPLADKGAKDVDIALLTEQGHSFDVHLKVGTVGMFAVTWGAATLPQVIQEDTPLRTQP
jgi:hypothetical protein